MWTGPESLFVAHGFEPTGEAAGPFAVYRSSWAPDRVDFDQPPVVRVDLSPDAALARGSGR